MRSYRVSLQRTIVVDMDGENSEHAISAALTASSNGEYNELWDNARAYYAGITVGDVKNAD